MRSRVCVFWCGAVQCCSAANPSLDPLAHAGTLCWPPRTLLAWGCAPRASALSSTPTLEVCCSVWPRCVGAVKLDVRPLGVGGRVLMCGHVCLGVGSSLLFLRCCCCRCCT